MSMTMREGGGRLREMDRLVKWSKTKKQGFDKGRELSSIKSERRHDNKIDKKEYKGITKALKNAMKD